MDTYTYDGEKYYYKNGKWLTSTYTSASLAIVSKLNQLLMKNEDLSGKIMMNQSQLLMEQECQIIINWQHRR